MSKNTFKKSEAKKLDAILMRMLEEYIEITENEDRDPKFSTYRKIREDITKYKESDAQKPQVKEEFKAFRRLWYYLKGAGHPEIKQKKVKKAFRKLWYYLEGAGHLEKAREDKDNKHNETFKITKEGLQFVLTGGYLKRYKKETLQSRATQAALITGILGLILSGLTFWFAVLRDNDAKSLIENNKKSELSNDLIEETNIPTLQADSIKEIQEQNLDSLEVIGVEKRIKVE